jgi:hypothetical protein
MKDLLRLNKQKTKMRYFVVSRFSVKWNRTLDKLDMAKKPGEEA